MSPGVSIPTVKAAGTAASRREKIVVDLTDSVSLSPRDAFASSSRSGWLKSGKSTLLHCASMRSASTLHVSGSMECEGEVMRTAAQSDSFARSVGFVPQQLDLTVDLELTAAENVYVQVQSCTDCVSDFGWFL